MVDNNLSALKRQENKRLMLQKAIESIQARLNNEAFDQEAFNYAKSLLVSAIKGDISSEAKEIIEHVKIKGFTKNLQEAAFNILKNVGVYKEDELFFIVSNDLVTEFNPEVLSEAEQLAAKKEFLHSELRTSINESIKLYAIDDPWTTEVDDAIGIEETDSGYRVHIVIADPGGIVPLDSLVAQSARERGSTIYLPDRKYLMFPPVISENAASLSVDKEIPAMDFVADMTPSGDILDFNVQPVVCKITQRLSYEEVEERIEKDDKVFKLLYNLAQTLRQNRIKNGAIIVDRPEVDVHVVDKEIRLQHIDPASKARILVSEFMVLAGTLAAQFGVQNAIPFVFRVSAPPDSLNDLEGIPEESREYRVRLLRHLSKASLSVIPQPHASVGASAYVQVTSPLRRFQDFLTHYQIKSFLAGESFKSTHELLECFGNLEEVMALHLRLQRDRKRYFLLKYLEQQQSEQLEAYVVMHEGRRTMLELAETGLVTWIDRLIGSRDEKVCVRIRRVDPEYDILKVEPC